MFEERQCNVDKSIYLKKITLWEMRNRMAAWSKQRMPFCLVSNPKDTQWKIEPSVWSFYGMEDEQNIYIQMNEKYYT